MVKQKISMLLLMLLYNPHLVHGSLHVCVCVCVGVCVCLGQCAILRNESDNKDNIFVIEKFTARLHMREFSMLLLSVWLGFWQAGGLAGARAAPQPPKVCYVTQSVA